MANKNNKDIKKHIISKKDLLKTILAALIAAIVAGFLSYFSVFLTFNQRLAYVEGKLDSIEKNIEKIDTNIPSKNSSETTNDITITSKYSFEDGPMGWVPQDYEDSRACVQVLQSNEKAKEGLYSLKMLMDLVGGDANKSKGEAWVDMMDNPPSGERIPINLTNSTVTAWVYSPQDSTGDRSRPNGFQLFVKDENWKSEYGTWHNVVEGKWIKISLTVSTSEPKNGWMDQGFNPSRIIVVGVKMGSGSGSTESYEGPVYLDTVDW